MVDARAVGSHWVTEGVAARVAEGLAPRRRGRNEVRSSVVQVSGRRAVDRQAPRVGWSRGHRRFVYVLDASWPLAAW